MKTFLFRLWQWTWGFPQSLLGGILFLLNRKQPHFSYHGAVVTPWAYGGSVSLGMFVFAHAHPGQVPANDLVVHEYGHCVQSLVLGPVFLLIVGLPSFLWASLPACQRYRRRKKVSYYRLYTEKWANKWGCAVTGEQVPE